MIRLKKTILEIVPGCSSDTQVLFDAPPQGNPCINQVHDEQLTMLCEQIRAHIQTIITITCSAHRVNNNNCMAIKLSGERMVVNILLTITGNLRWPTAQDYAHSPRWYINVPDAVDAVYLVEQLGIRLGQST